MIIPLSFSKLHLNIDNFLSDIEQRLMHILLTMIEVSRAIEM